MVPALPFGPLALIWALYEASKRTNVTPDWPKAPSTPPPQPYKQTPGGVVFTPNKHADDAATAEQQAYSAAVKQAAQQGTVAPARKPIAPGVYQAPAYTGPNTKGGMKETTPGKPGSYEMPETYITAPVPGAVGPSTTKQPTIKTGGRGDAVKRLQTALGVKADGIFGPGTASALKAYQASHGLTPDGICGPKTWAALGF